MTILLLILIGVLIWFLFSVVLPSSIEVIRKPTLFSFGAMIACWGMGISALKVMIENL